MSDTFFVHHQFDSCGKEGVAVFASGSTVRFDLIFMLSDFLGEVGHHLFQVVAVDRYRIGVLWG